jgi:Mn2+/Fe2+ NRAMP family transporter
VRFDQAFVSTLVAFVGTCLSPYLYFWQTGQRVEEEVCMGRRSLWQRRGASNAELTYAAADVNAGMTVACVIIYFVMLAAASTLHKSGQTGVGTAAEAAAALEPLAGKAAGAIFAVGFIGSGLLAIPVLTTGAAYAVGEAVGFKSGLHHKPKAAPAFYSVIAGCTLAGLAVNFIGLSQMRTLFIAAVINGLLAPVVLVLVMIASNRRSVVGFRKNGVVVNVLGWATAAAALAAAGTLVVRWVMPG